MLMVENGRKSDVAEWWPQTRCAEFKMSMQQLQQKHTRSRIMI